MLKECFKCLQIKPLSEFYKHKALKDGCLNKCKECTKSDVKENSIKVKRGYDNSEKGLIRVLYKSMKRSNKIRGFGGLPFSKETFSDWLYLNNFKKLYLMWIESSFEKDIKPSVDRLDSLKEYTFDNMQLITWGENRKRQYDDILSGSGSSGRRCKEVCCYSEDGHLLVTYVSASEAKRKVGYCIQRNIRLGTPCRNGMFYKYSE